MNEKICCSYQNSYLKHTLKSQGTITPAHVELFETWMGIGKKPDGTVKFDCQDCQMFLSIMESKLDKTLTDDNLKQETLKKVGCCRSIGMIDYDGQPNYDRFAFWLVNFKDTMCQSCNAKAYQFTLKTDLINTIVKEMKKYER